MGLRAKTVLFDDIFTGSHHFFLKVHGHDWILAGGLNNVHQLGKRKRKLNEKYFTVLSIRFTNR